MKRKPSPPKIFFFEKNHHPNQHSIHCWATKKTYEWMNENFDRLDRLNDDYDYDYDDDHIYQSINLSIYEYFRSIYM